jgi:(p)ppGpp synthase/HD superfamily hydrolase
MPFVPSLLTSRFDAALAYAVNIHRAQVRKGTAIPYVGHLLGVAALVLEDGAPRTKRSRASCMMRLRIRVARPGWPTSEPASAAE